MDKQAGVYKLTHARTGLFYIGHTSDFETRKKIHLSDLSNGRSMIAGLNTVFVSGDELLWEFTPTEDKASAIQLERTLISGSADMEGICNRMHAGYRISEEHRQTLSRLAQGRVVSDNTRRKLSESLTGRVMSAESIEKSRQGNLGQTRSLEARARMSAGHTATSVSTEGRKRISEAKSVPFTLSGVRYNSTEEAARILGVHRTTIRARRRAENTQM